MEGNLRTTAMGIMPHRDIERALELALSLDIPFFPQLPNVSFYEDMYAQVSAGFPGITLDVEGEKVLFSRAKFEVELEDYFERMEEEDPFRLRPPYSVVYERFLEQDLSRCSAIRGQVTGPVSFGFRVLDEELRPIIYDDEVRGILFDFIRRKVNVMFKELKARNENAFVWIDEPGLGWVFSGFSGYNDDLAREELRDFFARVEGIKGMHLCAELGLSYLLDLGVELLSFDAYQMGELSPRHAPAVAEFLRSGGVISWGVVPTEPAILEKETAVSLAEKVSQYFEVIAQTTGLAEEGIARGSLLAPARCCVRITEPGSGVYQSEEQAVETAFKLLKEVSLILKERYQLN